MYPHHIDEMVEQLVLDGVIPPSSRSNATVSISKPWQDKFAFVWCNSDIEGIVADILKRNAKFRKIPRKQRGGAFQKQVLEEAARRHDANEGINWDILRYHTHEALKNLLTKYE